MANIIEQWIESRGNEALQKLMHDETLTFEDKVILAIVAHREETKKEFASLNARMDKIDARMDKIDARLDKIDTRIEKLESRIFDLQNAQNALVWKILGGTGTILALSKAIEHFWK